MLPAAEVGFFPPLYLKEKLLVIITDGNKSDRIALYTCFKTGDFFGHKRTRKCDYFLPTLDSLWFYFQLIYHRYSGFENRL